MESLFRLTDLEARFPLNMNVLSHGVVPKVMPLDEVLREWLEHRRDVLVRRSEFRLEKIGHRLEVLGGYPDRLSQPRRGDPHHPRGGRAEGRS